MADCCNLIRKLIYKWHIFREIYLVGSLVHHSTTMFLYNLTLQRGTGITHAVHGNFSGTKQQEIIVSRGKILELLRPDPNTGKVYTLLTYEVFGVIRALMPFRLTGGSKGTGNHCCSLMLDPFIIYRSYGMEFNSSRCIHQSNIVPKFHLTEFVLFF